MLSILESEKDEIFFKEDRHVMSPILYPKIHEFYKMAEASVWGVAEIDMQYDMQDWTLKLNDNERFFISNILSFFASADNIVNENLAQRFYSEVKIFEIKAFYSAQIFIETVHSETYAMLIDVLIKDQTEKNRLFNAVETIPCVKKKADWAYKWITSNKSFAERLLGFICVEGLFFSGAFCSIYWLKKRGLMAGLTSSNELISRDEGLHCDFGCLLYSMLQNKLSQKRIYEIIGEAVEYEKEFITESLSVSLIGMNAEWMKEYIEFCADRLIYVLGYEKLYNAKNQFDWMELISLQGKTNFFEKRNFDYSKPGVMNSINDKDNKDNIFTTTADF